MRKIAILVTFIVAIAFIGTAMAVPPGKSMEFSSPMGKVTFDGKIHADAGKKCNDCHTKIFPMKKSAKLGMKAPHQPGKFCGTCHDGSVAFAQKGNCQKCHKR